MNRFEMKTGKPLMATKTPEKPSSTPVLISRFLDIREKPPISPSPEDFSEVFNNEQYRRHSFEEAKKSFDFVFDKNKFIKAIEGEKSKQNFSYLKQVRRLGLILRASYRFMDSDHECPEDLQQFVSSLGEYNDTYKINPSKELRKNIIAKLDNIKFPIDFVDDAEFRRYAKNLLADTEKLLKEKVLPIDEFHTLRKRLRLFADLMQVAAAENYGGNMHWLFHSIIELSSELGRSHDDLTQEGLRGNIDYHTSIVAVDPRVAPDFKKAKPFIKKVCGLTK
jgi:hypothetical protein